MKLALPSLPISLTKTALHQLILCQLHSVMFPSLLLASNQELHLTHLLLGKQQKDFMM